MSKKKREKVLGLLKERDLFGLLAWARSHRGAFRTLNTFTFDRDDLIRWRAIEALGKVAGEKAKDDPHGVRDWIRRLLWSMNDESGATGWHAPEVIGEILANVPALIPEYGGLLAHYFREEPFERGSCWAAARAATVDPSPFEKIREELAASLKSPDPVMRTWAFVALNAMGHALSDSRAVQGLEQETTLLTTYDHETGEIRRCTAGTIVQEAMRSGAKP
jgi:hypothetical protein